MVVVALSVGDLDEVPDGEKVLDSDTVTVRVRVADIVVDALPVTVEEIEGFTLSDDVRLVV